jgi:hypothetical protein
MTNLHIDSRDVIPTSHVPPRPQQSSSTAETLQPPSLSLLIPLPSLFNYNMASDTARYKSQLGLLLKMGLKNLNQEDIYNLLRR